jgi:hypothetical protein
LKPYGIKPKTLRIGEQTKAGYEQRWFSDAWRRYLPPVAQAASIEHAEGTRDDEDDSNAGQEATVSDEPEDEPF